MSDHDHHEDGVSRRRVLECMTWAGTGVLWTIAGGVPRSLGIVDRREAAEPAGPDLPADQRQPYRLRQAGQPRRARHAGGGDRQDQGAADEAVLHDPHRRHHPSVEGRPNSTTPTASSRRRSSTCITCRASTTSSTRRSSSTANATAAAPRAPAGISFDAGGVHFIGLVNVVDLKAGGLGNLGDEQLEWLENDLKGRSTSHADRGLCAHPAVDGLSALGLGHRRRRAGSRHLKRFGSVTVLNGHIHQVMQKVEGNVTFHTARSTAFPQPAPGTAPSPGPMKVADDKLRSLLGVASINFKQGDDRLAIIDTPLQG